MLKFLVLIKVSQYMCVIQNISNGQTLYVDH
jgi:hypothetical protein